MDQELKTILEEHSRKLDAIEASLKKVRSYMFWAFVASVLLFIIPLIGVLTVIPQFLNIYSSGGGL